MYYKVTIIKQDKAVKWKGEVQKSVMAGGVGGEADEVPTSPVSKMEQSEDVRGTGRRTKSGALSPIRAS